MKRKKTTAQKVKEILLKKENLQSVEYLIDQFRVFQSMAWKMRKLRRPSNNRDEISMRAVANQLGISKEDLYFSRENFLDNSSRNYFVKRMMEGPDRCATRIFPDLKHYSQDALAMCDGKTVFLDCQGETDDMIKIKGQLIEVHPYAIKVEYDDVKFLLFPAWKRGYYRNDKMKTNGIAWVCCKRDQFLKVKETLEKLKDKYDPIKGSMATFGSTFEIIELKEKFDISQVIVTPYVKEEIDFISNLFKNYKTLSASGLPFKRGVLFAGEPGTGKTTIVNALAKRVMAEGGTVFVMAAQKSTGCMGGVPGQEQVYKYINKFKPAMIVFEDFDLMAGDRDEKGGIDSELLNVLEGNLGVDGVITVATTNRVQLLDPAATRHGRIDKIYAIDMPNTTMKIELLKLHMDFYKVKVDLGSATEALKEVMEKSISGAVISSIVLTARQKASVEGRDVTVEDLSWAASGARKTKESLGFITK